MSVQASTHSSAPEKQFSEYQKRFGFWPGSTGQLFCSHSIIPRYSPFSGVLVPRSLAGRGAGSAACRRPGSASGPLPQRPLQAQRRSAATNPGGQQESSPPPCQGSRKKRNSLPKPAPARTHTANLLCFNSFCSPLSKNLCEQVAPVHDGSHKVPLQMLRFWMLEDTWNYFFHPKDPLKLFLYASRVHFLVSNKFTSPHLVPAQGRAN